MDNIFNVGDPVIYIEHSEYHEDTVRSVHEERLLRNDEILVSYAYHLTKRTDAFTPNDNPNPYDKSQKLLPIPESALMHLRKLPACKYCGQKTSRK